MKSSSLKISNLSIIMNTDYKVLPIELPFLHSLTQIKATLFTSGGRSPSRLVSPSVFRISVEGVCYKESDLLMSRVRHSMGHSTDENSLYVSGGKNNERTLQ